MICFLSQITSLVLDGITAALQERLRINHEVSSPYKMMFAINLFSALYLCFCKYNYPYSVIVALTGLPIGYSVIVALTGLPIGYSVIIALTGLPIGYSVIVALISSPFISFRFINHWRRLGRNTVRPSTSFSADSLTRFQHSQCPRAGKLILHCCIY